MSTSPAGRPRPARSAPRRSAQRSRPLRRWPLLLILAAACLGLALPACAAAPRPGKPAAWGTRPGAPHEPKLIASYRPFRYLGYSRLEGKDGAEDITLHRSAIGASTPLGGGLRWTREVAAFVSRGHSAAGSGASSAGGRNANTSGLGVSFGLQFFFGVTARVALALEGAAGGVGTFDRFPPGGDRFGFSHRLGASFSIRIREDMFLRVGGRYLHIGPSPDASAGQGAFEGEGVFIALNRWGS